MSIEAGSGGGTRKHRQGKRMKLLNQVLKEDATAISADELNAHGFPSRLVEAKSELHYNSSAFVEAANCDASGWKVVQPEEGLIYAACLPRCQAADLIREVARTGRGWRNYIVACHRDRIMGRYSWVPPITCLSIATEPVACLLEHQFYFWVFIDVDHMRRRLAELAPSLAVFEEEGHIGFETRKAHGYAVHGPRPIDNVQYGLASLESALRMLAEESEFDPTELLEGRNTSLGC